MYLNEALQTMKDRFLSADFTISNYFDFLFQVEKMARYALNDFADDWSIGFTVADSNLTNEERRNAAAIFNQCEFELVTRFVHAFPELVPEKISRFDGFRYRFVDQCSFWFDPRDLYEKERPAQGFDF